MGRDLHWYVIPRQILHDKTKPLCYNWECQPDNHEFTEYVSTPNVWCPKCEMFGLGFCDSPLVVATHHVRQSRYSKWNIHNLMMGSSTPFVNLFHPELLFREITAHDIETAERYLQTLGTPQCAHDIEAYEETQEVLTFLMKWTADDNYHVIIDDEC